MKLSSLHTTILRGAVIGFMLVIYVVIGSKAPLFYILKTHIDERYILLYS
jgi:hypothetical protein